MAEINITVHENTRPTGSIIKWIMIGVEVIDTICHSNNVVDECHKVDIILGINIINIDHIIILADDEMGYLNIL